MFLLDTNVVSELRKPKPHGGVLAWIEQMSDAELHLSAVTIGEIQAGIEITKEQYENGKSLLEGKIGLSANYSLLFWNCQMFAEKVI